MTHHERLESFRKIESESGCVYAAESALESLTALGFRSFAAVMSYAGGEPIGRNRARIVTRITGGGGGWFLKRFLEPDRKKAILGMLGLARVPTPARAEAEMAALFEAAGLATSEVAAFGESNGPPDIRSSFLLTREIAGGTDLLALVRAGLPDPDFTSAKRKTIPLLAAAVRRMHDAGLTHPDLYSYHIFALGNPPEGRFAFIDLQRALKRKAVGEREIARDLAGLFLTFPPAAAGSTDALRFLKAYCGDRPLKSLKKLARRIGARCKRIEGRRRFREIRGEGGPDRR